VGISIMCPHCQTRLPAEVGLASICTGCGHNINALVPGCRCWFCEPSDPRDHPMAADSLYPFPLDYSVPYSLEVVIGEVEVNLDIGKSHAVLSAITDDSDSEDVVHIIDSQEFLPICLYLLQLMNANQRGQLLNELMKTW